MTPDTVAPREPADAMGENCSVPHRRQPNVQVVLLVRQKGHQAVRALRRSAGFQDDENRLQVVFSSIQASSPKVLFGGKRASVRLQPGRRSFFCSITAEPTIRIA